MAKEITIELWPPQGGGVQIVQSPQGAIPLPIPAAKFNGVRDVSLIVSDSGKSEYLLFHTRGGDEVRTNLPYTIMVSTRSEGDA